MSGPVGSISYFFLNAWDFDLSIVAGCAVLLAGTKIWTQFEARKVIVYLVGVLLLFLALTSPLDALSDEYLFSAHMLQHFILLMIVPPLLILGLSSKTLERLLTIKWISKTRHYLSQPIFSWGFANFILWIWHWPRLYDLTLQSESIHIFEHILFLVSATIFWWVVLAPIESSRLEFGKGMIYLVLAGLSNMVLGIALTFLNEPIYRGYLNPADTWKILNAIRLNYHLDPLADQKLGGILMWVFGSAVFLVVILINFFQWYRSEELSEDRKLETA